MAMAELRQVRDVVSTRLSAQAMAAEEPRLQLLFALVSLLLLLSPELLSRQTLPPLLLSKLPLSSLLLSLLPSKLTPPMLRRQTCDFSLVRHRVFAPPAPTFSCVHPLAPRSARP